MFVKLLVGISLALPAVTLTAPRLLGDTPNLPGMAGGVLEQSDLARQAVTRHDRAGALDHIQQANTLSDDILKAEPVSRSVLVPVYKEIDTTNTYSVKRGRHDELNANTSVQGVDEAVTTGKLDVTQASVHLAAAREAVERQDWTAADSALGAIRSSIVRIHADGTDPLAEARQNLEFARTHVREEKWKDARTALRLAAQNLADFEHVSATSRSADVENVRQQVDNSAQNITHDHALSPQLFDDWLNSIDQWNEKAFR